MATFRGRIVGFIAGAVMATGTTDTIHRMNPVTKTDTLIVQEPPDTATWKLYSRQVVNWEGTVKQWQSIPANKYDRGGLTNRGITYPFYQSACLSALGVEPTDSGFWGLTPEDADAFLQFQWNVMQCDSFNAGVAITLCENGWGSGAGSARIRIKKVMNERFGGNFQLNSQRFDSKFFAFVNALNADSVIKRYTQERRDAIEWDVKNHPQQAVFRNGWLMRVNRIEKFIFERKLNVKRPIQVYRNAA